MVGGTTKILDTLSGVGLLLTQDKRLPNVVTLVTGEFLRTSWWSHPKGRLIFKVLSELSDHPDVLFSKLLYGKVTLIHRKLWPAFLTVASANEPWQVRGLTMAGQQLLKSLSESKEPIRSSGRAVKELEVKLLAHAKEVHTESGRHELLVEPWTSWSRDVGVEPLHSVVFARQQLEEATESIGASRSALPWISTKKGC
jgi:hypothetical protein